MWRGCFRTSEQGSGLLETSQSEVCGPTPVLFREPLADPVVGVPVLVASLPGLLAYSQLTLLPLKGEGRDRLQPGEPGRLSRGEREELLARI